ncbi:hypothetical protein Pmar_PMAR018437, partial [Perkinsus marinus ATCC 50983]
IHRESNEARLIECSHYEDFQNSEEDLHEAEMTVWDESRSDDLEGVDNEELQFDELLPLAEERIYL